MRRNPHGRFLWFLKFRLQFDKLRPRRVPSHAFVVNLVRPGTEQPQRSECSAEDKARHFFFFLSVYLVDFKRNSKSNY